MRAYLVFSYHVSPYHVSRKQEVDSWELMANWLIYNRDLLGGARSVMVIVVGNGHGDASSNSGRDWLHFT